MNEEWRVIGEYDGKYEVSNLGQIRSYARKNSPGKILKGQVSKHGYRIIQLSRGKKLKAFLVHRLVAQAFIPNPMSLPQINHKDENKLNNAASNLEWCTAAENLAYGTAPRRRQQTRSKPCIGIWKDGTIQRYESTSQAEMKTGIHHGSISQVCNGIRKSAGKAKWQWAKKSIGWWKND